jgi:hypothetical protein
MRAAKALGKEGITILPAAKLRLGLAATHCWIVWLAAPATASPAVAQTPSSHRCP